MIRGFEKACILQDGLLFRYQGIKIGIIRHLLQPKLEKPAEAVTYSVTTVFIRKNIDKQ